LTSKIVEVKHKIEELNGENSGMAGEVKELSSGVNAKQIEFIASPYDKNNPS
jgi:cell division protein FtsL